MALGVYLRQLGLEPVEERLFDVKNVRLEVTSCGTGDKLALCLHGFPEHAYSWRHQVPMLVKMGYRVWVPNLRGYGRSDKPSGAHNYALGELIQDIAGLLDIAKAKDVTLIGHDWGAMIAWEFALRRIRPIDRLVILNVPHPAIFAGRVREPYQRKRSWYMWFFQIPFVPEFLLKLNGAQLVGRMMKKTASVGTAFTPEVLHVYKDNALRPGAMTAMVNYYRANFFRKAPEGLTSEPGVPVIDIPTLMIWGEDDTALDLRLVPGTDKYVKHLTVKTLPHVAHWVQQEAPDQVNDLLQSWLAMPEAKLTEPRAAPAAPESRSYTDVGPMEAAAPAAASVAVAAPAPAAAPATEDPVVPPVAETEEIVEDLDVAASIATAGTGAGASEPPLQPHPENEIETETETETGARTGGDRAPSSPPESGSRGSSLPKKRRTEKDMMDWIDWQKPRVPKAETPQDPVSEVSSESSESSTAAPVSSNPKPVEVAAAGNDPDTDAQVRSEPQTEENDPMSDTDTLDALDSPRPLKKTLDRAPEAPAAVPTPTLEPAAVVDTPGRAQETPDVPRKVQEPLILTREQMLSPAQAVQMHIRMLRQRFCFEDL